MAGHSAYVVGVAESAVPTSLLAGEKLARSCCTCAPSVGESGTGTGWKASICGLDGAEEATVEYVAADEALGIDGVVEEWALGRLEWLAG